MNAAAISKTDQQLATYLRNMAAGETQAHRADAMREAANRLDRAMAETRAMQVARNVAGYHIGDPSWADLIVNAYLNPEEASEKLRQEMDS